MFIAIFIAILLAAGLYFFKSKKSPLDKAKAKFDKVLRSALRQSKKMAIASATPDFEASSLVALQHEVASQGAAMIELLTSIHQEFGITILPPPELEDATNPNLDIESIKLEWMKCPKNFEMGDCWEKSINR